MKTLDLRKLITEQLLTINGLKVHYRIAPTTETFPYVVFSLDRCSFTEDRNDYDLCIDAWDKSRNTKNLDNISDNIEELFDKSNLPQTSILPTFFKDVRYPVNESDKDIQHIQMHFTIEMYDNK